LATISTRRRRRLSAIERPRNYAVVSSREPGNSFQALLSLDPRRGDEKKSIKAKQQRGQAQGVPRPTAVPEPRSSVKRWAVLALCLLLAGGGTWAFFEFVVWNRVPAELVGKWVVTEGPDEGGTIDFYRGGTMVAHVNLGGNLGIIEAKIRVEDRKIIATLRNQQTGAVGTRVQTIKVQEGKRLVLEDERGNLIKLERAD
jgi:hypothetical protein